MGIKIKNIAKNFDNTSVLKDINLEIKEGKITALLGPSGSGKTTLLRIIAGLEKEDRGDILFFGESVIKKSPMDRNIGFGFQHYALFKHMSIYENIAFGLKVKPKKVRPSKESIDEKVTKLLKMIQLEDYCGRYPDELSGGQKQRVALARALAVEPKILLLDEPFGALDARVRQDLRKWLKELHKEIDITTIFVTHDQEEALEVSDEIVILNRGHIEQVGTPQEVYDHPKTPFVYNFLGSVNELSGDINEGEVNLHKNSKSTLFVRPHEINITLKPTQNSKEATIVSHSLLGSRVRIILELEEFGLVEADASRVLFSQITEQNAKSVHVSFGSLKVYSQDKQWSDYVI